MVSNFPSVFKAEVFRPLLITFIPGALAILPWVILADASYAELANFRNGNAIPYYFGLLCAALSVGMILENMGSTVEVLCWDRCLGACDSNFSGDWDKFLQETYANEPVGHRYLRSILLRMKFATHLALAIVFFLAGVVVSSIQTPWPGENVLALVLAFGAVLTVYLLWESYASCVVLAKVRKLLIANPATHP